MTHPRSRVGRCALALGLLTLLTACEGGTLMDPFGVYAEEVPFTWTMTVSDSPKDIFKSPSLRACCYMRTAEQYGWSSNPEHAPTKVEHDWIMLTPKMINLSDANRQLKESYLGEIARLEALGCY